MNRNKSVKRVKRWLKFICIAVVLCLTFFILSNYWIKSSTAVYIYSSLSEIPYNKVGIVLGANKELRNGKENAYFKYRVEAAAQLYHNGKVDLLILSGDNHTVNYNEPEDMKSALIELGIPEGVITLDYAGFRTFDSMVRLKKVFQQNQVTIISQKFHLERALYIARQFDMNAIGYAAKDVRYRDNYQIREFLAKGKSIIDCWIIFKQPRFLGDAEVLNGDF